MQPARHEVVAHGVAPVHGPPQWAVGVILVKQMVLTGVVDQTVGIVDPVGRGCEVVDWPERIDCVHAGTHL